MINISTISTANKGGAGIAAFRLHASINQSKDVHSNFINSFNPTNEQLSIHQLNPIEIEENISFLKKVHLKINPSTNFYDNNETKYHKKLSPLNLTCEFFSLPFSKYLVENNSTVKSSDIIHLHWVAELLNYPSFFKEVKQPIVWTLHDMNAFQGIFHYKNDELNNTNASKIDRDIYARKKEFIHQHNNIHVVCLTDWMLEASKNSEILGRYPHYLIPNGLDFNHFNITETKKELKSKYAINNNNKTLLFVSQDIKNIRKGFDLLNKSLKLITDSQFNVITVGNNNVKLPENFNHIHFNHIDDINKLNELYVLADLFLLPSREDNLPNVMLESWANGTPIISFNTGGMKDWVIPNKNGILIDNFSINSFAEELINFANNKYTFDSKFIRHYAEQNFNQVNQTKKYIELYQSILK